MIYREVKRAAVELTEWIVENRHGQSKVIFDGLAIGCGDRLSKVKRTDDEIVLYIFVGKLLVNLLRLTGEVLTASSPVCVQKEPCGIFRTEIME